MFGARSVCSVTATFTPLPNHAYRALLALHYENRTCDLQIADQNNVAVPFQTPVYSCHKSMSGIFKNGQAGFSKNAPVPVLVPIR
jgi:hypothetical protein